LTLDTPRKTCADDSATIGAVPDECSVEPHIGAKRASRGVVGRSGSANLDVAMARLAERQHGVVARRQLLGLGIGRRAIGNRLSAGRLHPIHRGVYAVGHRVLPPRGRWMAAVLAGGPGAVLSHRSAGSLWGMLRSARAVTDVTNVRRHRSRAGVQLHRSRLPSDEVTSVEGIPITSPPRTLLDLAAMLDAPALERALEQTEALRLTDSLSLDDILMRHPRRPGAAALREILATGYAPSTVTRSKLEDRFLSFLADYRLPRPRVNAWIEVRGRWMECDCVWPSHRLVVELDSRRFHGTRAAFERDRARDRVLQAAGWRVVRITWRQLHDDADRVAADLRGLLTIPP
jgi:very-short-patch-repair endonuclease